MLIKEKTYIFSLLPVSTFQYFRFGHFQLYFELCHYQLEAENLDHCHLVYIEQSWSVLYWSQNVKYFTLLSNSTFKKTHIIKCCICINNFDIRRLSPSISNYLILLRPRMCPVLFLKRKIEKGKINHIPVYTLKF